MPEPLYVYFEGDGRPWDYRGTAPRANPDPKHALALTLAATQEGRAQLLGRPCYFGHAGDPGCVPDLWTGGRYSPTVVESMSAALQNLMLIERVDSAVLIGYSGGGALALLVADRVPGVNAVVTVAGNIDPAAWTEYHHYLPLSGSLNPLEARSHPPGCEIHIAAERDAVVPTHITAAAVKRRPSALLWIEPGLDHACCWKEHWPDIFARVRQQLTSSGCFSPQVVN